MKEVVNLIDKLSLEMQKNNLGNILILTLEDEEFDKLFFHIVGTEKNEHPDISDLTCDGVPLQDTLQWFSYHLPSSRIIQVDRI